MNRCHRAYDNMEEDDRIEMRNDFNAEIKLKFFPDNSNGGGTGEDGGDGDDNDGDGDLDDDDDVVCVLPGVPDDPEKGVRRRKITFSTKDMKEIFEQTFKEISELVQEQVTAAQVATKKNVDVGAAFV